ncbi:MAG: SusC/RagA family TonB-linked outer membrane protein [Saprospiraceae bacterium]
MIKKIILFLSLLMVLPLTIFSQIQVKGNVTSNEGEPLIGATVMLKNTATGTITDFDGNYVLDLPDDNGVLMISYTGYLDQEVAINGQKLINVVLPVSQTLLEEVVVIGYGASKKGTVTGSIAQVSSERLESRAVTRVEQALAGQMAGVRVRATTGDLGAPLQISIRGNSSVSASNEPLYVVDGFPTSDIADLVISDIASIAVLKDASSTAIYGSRGANGVVLITTKSGKKGKAKFSVNVYRGVQTLEKKIDLLSAEEWIDISKQIIDTRWVNRGKELGLNYQASDSYEYRIAELGGHNNNYMHDTRWEDGTDSLAFIDWQDELFRAAAIQEYQVSASGGSDQIKYHISGTLFQQDGIVQHTDFTRLNFRSNLQINFTPKLSLGLSLSPTYSTSNGGRVTGKDAIVHYALNIVPVANKDVGLETGVYPNPTYEYGGSYISPVAYMREIEYNQDDFRARTNVSLNYQLAKSLRLKLSGAADNRALKLHRYLPTNVARRNTNAIEGELSNAVLDSRRDNKYLLQATLNFNKSFGKHGLTALGGYSVESRERDRAYQKHSQLSNDKLLTFNETTSTPTNSFYQIFEDRLISYFARSQYNFDDRYLLSASIRRDGSSRFGRNNLWGNFPSVSAAWRVSNESFMQDLPAISSLKFRYSFGETGNNRIPEYRSYSELGSGNYSFGNQLAFGLATTSIENYDLGWEKTQSSNFGLDLGLFKNRIFVSADYYQKNTRDMLYYVPVATVTGFTNGWQNIGEMENQGVELELTTRNIVKKFKWETSLNLSRNTNSIVSLGPDDTPILAGFQGRTEILKVGEPLFSFYMYEAIGVYKNQAEVESLPSRSTSIPGDIIYRDVNNDGIITELDKTIVGNPEPDFFWGIMNTFKYKNFDLSILLQGQIGGEIYGMIGRAIDNPSGQTLHNRPAHWKDRWISPENPGNGVVPRVDATTSSLYDSRWLYDATYWKIKNITLTYNLPKDLFRGFRGGQVYFSGDNIFMKDNYTIGFSPEAENNEGGDYGGYPLARVMTLGLRTSF